MDIVDGFNVEDLGSFLQECQLDEDDVIIEVYLKAYEEINKFFYLMGSVFSFVSSDVRSKLDIIGDFLKDEQVKDHFYSVKSMMNYEKSSGLLDNPKYVSGSRTILRLHRGFEFLFQFLSNLHELELEEKVHGACKTAYNATLAKHHPFLIRNGALVAMYTLPTKMDLLKKVCYNYEAAMDKFPFMLKELRCVYDRCESLYAFHQLKNLP